MKIINYENNLIEDQILQIENEIKILRSENLKIDLVNLIRKLNELKKLNRYEKFGSGYEKFGSGYGLRKKPLKKLFSDPYRIRYNKQLLHLVLGAEK